MDAGLHLTGTEVTCFDVYSQKQLVKYQMHLNETMTFR